MRGREFLGKDIKGLHPSTTKRVHTSTNLQNKENLVP